MVPKLLSLKVLHFNIDAVLPITFFSDISQFDLNLTLRMIWLFKHDFECEIEIRKTRKKVFRNKSPPSSILSINCESSVQTSKNFGLSVARVTHALS